MKKMVIKNTEKFQADLPLVDACLELKKTAPEKKMPENEGRLLFWGKINSADLPA